MKTLQEIGKNILANNGGPIDAADGTTDGKDYVMVLRSDFDELAKIYAEKSHLVGPVIVNADRYKGHAIALPDRYEQDGNIACLLENGNTWRYPIETVKRVKWTEMPRSNRRAYLRSRGIKCL